MSDTRYFIKRRKSYALVAYRMSGRSKIYLELPSHLKLELKSINEKFLKGLLTRGQAELLLKEIIRRETPQSSSALRASMISVNRVFFDAFWKDVYGVRYLEDERSAKYDFLKAFRLLEPMSIQTATAAEIQNRLKIRCKNSQEVRRATDRLNQVLKYLKRDIRLNKPKPPMRVIRHITLLDLLVAVKKIEDTILQDLVLVLFASGMRLGEALALEPKDYQNSEVNIDKQITEHGKRKLPKREKVGRSLVLPCGHEAMLRWVQVKDKPRYRYKVYDALVRCAEVSPHDLRHSHAIHLLSLGASLTQVALQLRNRIEVCQAYYTGFAHKDETIEYLKRVLDKK